MKTLTLHSILYLFPLFLSGNWTPPNLDHLPTAITNSLVEDTALDYDRNTLQIDRSGNLLYSDALGLNDDLTISLDGTNFRLHNAAGALTAGRDMIQKGDDVLVPTSLVRGEIRIDTQGGDDTITIDLSKGNINVPIYYNGGAQNTTSGDDMVLIGTDNKVYETVTHTFVNNSDGFVDIAGNSRIAYVGLEPITDNLNAANRVFTFTGNLGNIEQITLDAGGTLDNRIDSTYGESVDFNNPSSSLTINLNGFGEDYLDIRGLSTGFDADLIVNGETEDDVRLINNTDLGSGDLNITCDLLTLSSNLTTSGSITTSSKNRTFIAGQLTSNGGNISITAGTELVPGDFGTILMHNGHVTTTGSGTITLNATAYANNNINFVLNGVYMRQNSSLNTDTGNIQITGNGIDNGRANFRGVRLENGANIQSNSGNITINGTGRNVSNNQNAGVSLESGPVQTGGTVNITGTGYIGIDIANEITDAGSMTLQGTSAVATAPAIDIRSASAKITSNNLIMTANVGSLNTESGAASQETIAANNTTINGTLAPGQSPGQFRADTNLTIGAGSHVEIETNGTVTAGNEYDQIVVNGAIDISGVTFNLIDNATLIVNETMVIIDNDGTDPVIGTFTGLPEGTAIAGNGRTWNIHYNANDGNDVVLVTTASDVNVQVDNSGNLVFEDPFGVDDNITIAIDGANYRISDPGRTIVPGFLAIQDGNDVLVPIAAVTGMININTETGNDQLTIDLNGGDFSVALDFDGGTGNDSMQLSGSGNYNDALYSFYNTHSTVLIAGNELITYTGLESSVLDPLNVAYRGFLVHEGNDAMTLDSSPTAVAYRIGTAAQGWVDFNFGSNGVVIGTRNNVSVNYFGTGFDGDFLIVNGPHNAASLSNTIDINAAINLGSGNLNFVAGKLNVNQSITTTGNITTSTTGKTLVSDSKVESTVGNIMMTGGTNAPEDRGIHAILGSEIRTTSGNIQLTGTARNAYVNMGIRLENSSAIYADSGSITLIGNAGTYDGQSYGVHLSNTATIENNGGDITITGTSTTRDNEYSGGHVGVFLIGTGTIKTTGTGNINVTGSGGISETLGGNHGIVAHGGFPIMTENGDVNMTGTGIARYSDGIQVRGAITTTGTGNVILQGEALNIDNNAAIDVIPSAQIIAGGDIDMTATTAPIRTAGGIPSQIQFTADDTVVNGTLSPGQSPGQMIVSGNFKMDFGDVLRLEINDFYNPGFDFDQIKVDGEEVRISDATLEIIDNSSGTLPEEGVILTIIDNEGSNPLNGRFDALPNGTAIPGNGKTWYLYYADNDVLLSSYEWNVYVDGYGNLVFDDVADSSDNLTIAVSGTNYRISDLGKQVTAGFGAVQDGNDVLVPMNLVTGDINIITGIGNDRLNVNFNGGNFSSPINFDGGSDSDGLSLSGIGTFESLVHTVNGTGEGTVEVTGNGTITYVGLEQTMVDNLNVNDRTFTLNSSNQTVFAPRGSLANQVEVDGVTTIDYYNPNTSLTINGSGATQGSTQINQFAPGFDANLNIAKINDQVRIGVGQTGTEIDLGTGDLSVVSKVVLVRENVTTAGAITLTSLEAAMVGEANITASGGKDITINGGTQLPQQGGFTGVDIGISTIQTNGAGTITINGFAFLDNPFSFTQGVQFYQANLISDTGDINITGTGPAIAAGHSLGINMTIDVNIQSNGGNINITGTAGNSIGNSNTGIFIHDGTNIQTTGSGTIDITGTGGVGLDNNYGVEMQNNTMVSAENGNISITGTSTENAGTGQIGLQMDGVVRTMGTGDIHITGTSGRANNAAINLVSSNAQLHAGGFLYLTSNVGPIHTPSGVASQAQCDARKTYIDGTLAPGQSPGQLIIEGNMVMQFGDVLDIEVNDFDTAGTDYDQVVVRNGYVELFGATFSLTDTSGMPSPDADPEILVLIDNQGTEPVVGFFGGYPNGTAVAGNGKTWYIYYNGGDGNDVVLSTEMFDVLNVFPRAYLQGAALNPNIGEETLMRDDLRVAGHIPTTSPYADGKTINAAVLAGTGNQAIVDWVWVELRNETNIDMVVDGQSGLLQRDGDIVSVDGFTPLSFNIAPGNYYVGIKHRNHLGIVSSNPIALDATWNRLDFSNGNVPTFGSHAQTTFGMPAGVSALWAGDVNNDGRVVFINSGAESVDIKQTVLDVSAAESPFGASVFYKPQGYYNTDIDMDGEVIFLNAGNELLYIKDNILAHPGNQIFNSVFYTIRAQLPEFSN